MERGGLLYHFCSTIGAGGFHYRVRYGTGWFPARLSYAPLGDYNK